MTMTCASCGARFDDIANFCPGCGQRITVRRTPLPGAPPRVPSAHMLPKEEVNAALATREELGERMEPEIIDAFLDRVDRAIEARVDARVEQRLRGRGIPPQGQADGAQAVAISSIALGIPITVLAGVFGGVPGIIAAWIGIGVVNGMYLHRDRN